MKIFPAILRGLRTLAGAPRLLLGLWLINLAFALPAALALGQILEAALEPSLFEEGMARGFDADWYADFEVALRGEEGTLASTFTPSVVGAGPIWDNLEAWWSGRLFTESPALLVGIGGLYALLWTFLYGGILARLGDPEAPRGFVPFLAASGRTFGRFVLLALASGALYALVYALARGYYGWLEEATRDVTRERTVLAAVLAGAVVTVLLMHGVRMLFDYARIAIVLGDRGQDPGERLLPHRALWRALRFILRHPLRTGGVYACYGILSLAVLALYAWLAPGAGQASWLTVILAFLLSQLYLTARLALRLGLLGAEVGVLAGRG